MLEREIFAWRKLHSNRKFIAAFCLMHGVAYADLLRSPTARKR